MAETVNTYEEPAQESQEHIDAMLKKAEGNTSSADRPDWLPEKFKSAEDMAKAYSELESKLGTKQEEQQETNALEEEVNQSSSEVAEALDSKGLDFDAFQQEYMENGELSSEAYAALDEAGFSRTLVDTWIEGQNALASQLQSEMYSTVGGADQYNDLVTWASENLPEEEIDAYNAAMDTQDPAQIRFAVQGLYARYRSEAEPNLVQAGTGEVSTGGKFSSNAELTAAMRDPRYAKDPAYRQQVADKLARSSLF